MKYLKLFFFIKITFKKFVLLKRRSLYKTFFLKDKIFHCSFFFLFYLIKPFALNFHHSYSKSSIEAFKNINLEIEDKKQFRNKKNKKKLLEQKKEEKLSKK